MAWSEKFDKNRSEKITRKLAEEWRDSLPAPNDRPLNDRRMKIHRDNLSQGKFRTVDWGRAYCKETGLTYRVNGKHTSTLFASLDVIPNLRADIHEFVCDTLVDVADLYSTYDTRDTVRSVGDINKVFAGSVPELKDMSGKILDVLVSGLAYVEKSESYHSIPREVRAKNILGHVEFAKWAGGLIAESKEAKKKLCRVPVVAAMFKTWTVNKLKAEVFWVAVIDESGRLPNMPDRQLSRWLSDRTTKSPDKESKAYWTEAKESYGMCLTAWSDWRSYKDDFRGEYRKLRYRAKDPLPQVHP